ncbi:hypothetical protein OS493_017862 [Desmophyllum pertusum]|uniref:Uncharacterized protein n=1 Tax=Desmophyllum pertusum TaxID=174260 RepID=A0A9W9Z076_9CNID|nr:hypothetical protein OS493_017862 [Desmophyllum pertusum]
MAADRGNGVAYITLQAYPQTGISYGSGHYAGMQQQLPAMNPQRPQQQQQRSSGFPAMNPGQMIPRSPNNGMMQPDMDLVLQQQQYQQQQSQQSAYGNGNYNQGFNGGYQNPRPVSPQTMSPYQAGFPSEPGYPSGTGSSQTMGEFGPQAGPNQTMGMPGPASLSLAAMSNRQQYYSDGYGMNPPVSPLHKQMPQGGGFLQPSGMPYSQQVQSYQSSSYPKRPPSSPVQTQMPGFSSGGSSYTPRSSAGMQLPNMPYQSSTNPYQPPHSPGRRSSTSPVPQQDTGIYSRPHEHYPQPRSPFGTSQVHFQQQQPQQQPQQHSSCMFVQPSTTPPQSHYQSQQLMAGTKAGGLTQRRSSYPGQQNTVKMPQSPPPHKRSPPSKIPSPNPKSPDLTRPGQLGFEERGPSTTKETASSPPCSDPSQGISETTGVVSSSVQCSFKKKATASKKIIKVEGHKGVPHQRRSTASPSSAESPSVSPPTVKKECMDGMRSKAEEMSGKQEESFKNNEGLVKIENVERKSKDPNGSNEISKVEVSSHSSKGQEGNKEERSLQSSADSKGKESCGSVGEERRQSEVNKTQPDKTAAVETTSQAPQTIVNTEEERKESEGTTANTGKPGSNAKMPIRESDKTKTSPARRWNAAKKTTCCLAKGAKSLRKGKTSVAVKMLIIKEKK